MSDTEPVETIDTICKVVVDRTMSAHHSFPLVIRRLSCTSTYRVRGVGMNDCCGVYGWDGANSPFRPVRLMRFVSPGGYMTLVGDGGCQQERMLKFGGRTLQDSAYDVSLNETMNLNLPGNHRISMQQSLISYVEVITPFCLCCRHYRAQPDTWFCPTCVTDTHLWAHYIPHGGNYIGCCLVANDFDLVCWKCNGDVASPVRPRRRMTRSMTCARKSSLFPGLPELDRNVVHVIASFLVVPSVLDAYVDFWVSLNQSDSDRHNRLMITFNKRLKVTFDAMDSLAYRRGYNATPNPFTQSYYSRFPNLVSLDAVAEEDREEDPYIDLEKQAGCTYVGCNHGFAVGTMCLFDMGRLNSHSADIRVRVDRIETTGAMNRADTTGTARRRVVMRVDT